MLIKEIQEKNQAVLDRATKIELLIKEALKKGYSLSQDISECGNAQLYYMSTASLTVQAKAPLGEKFLCNLLGFRRLSSRENRGDAIDELGRYYEFKNSFTNQAKNLNIRQIRLWQEIDFYYCFYINEEDLSRSIFFVLSKEQMIEEVALCGGFTHGTIEANAVNQHCEYSITIPIYNNTNIKTKRWKERYLSIELKNRILGELI